MIEDCEEFRKLTPAEKLYYWLLLSEFNRRGEFYKSDLEIAVTLNLSEVKIRNARRKLGELEFIKYQSGFISEGRRLATRYVNVKWATPINKDFFAQIHRYAFEAMLAKIRDGRFAHAEVVTYVYLAYLFWKNRGKKEDQSFFITKIKLQELTGIPNVQAHVKKLYDKYLFSSNEHLFEYSDKYHKLALSKWTSFADPAENENNQRQAEAFLADIKAKVTAKKKAAETKKKTATKKQQKKQATDTKPKLRLVDR